MADEPAIGPMPPSNLGLGAAADLRVKNLGAQDADDFETVREKFSKREQDHIDKALAASVKSSERQEWMLKPGSGKITQARAMKNRKFTSEGPTQQQLEDEERRNSDPQKLAEMHVMRDKLQAELEAYNKKHDRCESLLDRHRRKLSKSEEKKKKKKKEKSKKSKKKKSKKEKKSKKGKKRKHSTSSGSDSSSDSDEPPEKQERVAFNWERDMKINKTDVKHAKGILKGSHALNSRFSSTGLQNKFM